MVIEFANYGYFFTWLSVLKELNERLTILSHLLTLPHAYKQAHTPKETCAHNFHQIPITESFCINKQSLL